MPDQDLRELVQQNMELTEKIAKDIKKIRHHFWLSSVWSLLKLVIILAPLAGGYFFLRPYLGTVQETYHQIIGFQKTVSDLKEDIGTLQQSAKGLGKATQGTSPESMNLSGFSGAFEALFGKK